MFTKRFILTPVVAALLTAGLAGCQADADGSLSAGPNGNGTGVVDNDDGIDDNGDPTGNGGNTDTGFPNDPNGPGGDDVGGIINEDGGADDDGDGSPDDTIAYGDTTFRFKCTQSAQSFYGATTEVGANGLVGGQLTDLLNPLGAGSVTALLNSVSDKDLAIDGTLATAATFTLTASALSLATDVDSLDLNVLMPTPVAAGNFAVFAVSFPPGLLNLGLLTSVSVATYLGDSADPAEPAVTFDATQLDLLGTSIMGTPYAFIGRKVTKPYDRAVISLQADLLAVDAGEAMYVHELCTGGNIVAAAP